jgi:hypothetical protein
VRNLTDVARKWHAFAGLAAEPPGCCRAAACELVLRVEPAYRNRTDDLFITSVSRTSNTYAGGALNRQRRPHKSRGIR